MDYEWLYPYYCHSNRRPGTDPVALIQHLFGVPSLRQISQRIHDTLSYRWFLGYGLLDEIPHFATASYAFCQRFPDKLSWKIFAHILNKTINNRMVDTSSIFIDGTHIWQEYPDIVEGIQKTELGKHIYVQKEFIAQVFAGAKGKHAMRYTRYSGLTAVIRWVG